MFSRTRKSFLPCFSISCILGERPRFWNVSTMNLPAPDTCASVGRGRTPQRLTKIFGIFAIFFFAGAVGAQVNPGTPSFSAYDSHTFDTINLQNLNIVLNVPIYSKSGAFPFTFGATGNFYIWQAIGGYWYPSIGPNNPTLIGSTNGTLGVAINGGNIGNTAFPEFTQTAYCSGSGQLTTMESNWFILFADGTKHWLPPTDYTDSLGCFKASFTDQTIDGSGYTLSVTKNVVNSIYSSAGTLISTLAIQDSNSNTISMNSAGTAWVDTLGATALNYSNSSGYYWTDVNNGSPAVSIATTSYTLRSAFSSGSGTCTTGTDYNFPQQPLPSTITFPDTTKIDIYYEATPGYASDRTGRLAQIVNRAGGTVTYSYSGSSNGIDCTYQVTPTLTRTTSDGPTTYTWAAVNNGAGDWGNTTTVIDPGGNKKVYTFTGLTSTGSASLPVTQALTEVQTYTNTGTPSNPSYTPLTTDDYCYNGQGWTGVNSCSTIVVSLPIGEIDVYHTINGMSMSSRTQTQFDGYGNVLYSAQYDFSASPQTATPTTSTTIVYGTGSSCTPVSSTIHNKPCTITTTENGNTISVSKFAYDAFGNLLTKYVSPNGGSTFLSNPTVNKYNSNGTSNTIYDFAGNKTTYSYTGGCNNLFPTSTTTANNLTVYDTWNCTGGVKVAHEDANLNTINYKYINSAGKADPWWRLSQTIDPYGNDVYTNYNAASNIESAFAFSSSVSNTWVNKDEYGRTTNVQHAQSSSGTNYDTRSTSYAWLPSGGGFQTSTTIPCSVPSGSPCTSGITASTTDVLGRLTSSTDAGGGTVSVTYAQNDVTTAVGPPAPNENYHITQNQYDGLGRLTSSCAVGSVSGGYGCGQNTGSLSGVTTSYQYLSPNGGQTVVTSARGCCQSRGKTYDGLSRVINYITPEGGNTHYTYDSASTLCAGGVESYPGHLVLKNTANGDSVCYFYDTLGRVTDEGGAYKGATATTVCRRFRFDSASNGVQPQPSGSTITNGAGRMVEAETDNCIQPATAITDEWFSYDDDGRMTDMWELTPNSGVYYHSKATFFGNGAVNVLTLANPSLYALTYGLDGEGRWNTATSGSTNIVTGTTYNAAGQPLKIPLQASDNDAYVYDPNTGRMKTWDFTVNGKSETGTLSWNANWTLEQLQIVDGFNSAGSQTCDFNPSLAIGTGYDDLGRLMGVDCGAKGWGQTFIYDEYDNLNYGVISGRTGTTWGTPYYHDSNHYSPSPTYAYDASGNLVKDPVNSYTWDPFGKMLTTNSTGIVYDAMGRAVEIDTSTASTEIWYTQLGKTAYMNGSTINYAYWPMPGGGTLLEIGNSGSDYYLHKDWQGNARISTSVGGHALVADNAFSPYGEVYNVLNSTNQNERMFTGLSQDILSAMWDTPNRELSSVGRWLSPDPAGAGWNQYAYSTNPNSLVDPSGLDPTSLGVGGCKYSPVVCTGGLTQNNSPGDGGELGLFSSIFTVGLAADPYTQEITQGPASAGGTVPSDVYTGVNPDGTTDTSWMTAGTGLLYSDDGSVLNFSDPLMTYQPPTELDVAVTGAFIAGPLSMAADGVSLLGLAGLGFVAGDTAASTYVFWSGDGMQEAAEAWAQANNGITINMTALGQEAEVVESMYGEGSPEATAAWQSASEAFANAASGPIQVFSSQPLTNFGNVWYNTELPIIANNPQVTGMTLHLVP